MFTNSCSSLFNFVPSAPCTYSLEMGMNIVFFVTIFSLTHCSNISIRFRISLCKNPSEKDAYGQYANPLLFDLVFIQIHNTWPLHNVKYSTYMRSAWWANQNVHLLHDLLARGSMKVKITFTRYEKYVHVTRAQICKPFKEPRNRFPAWRTGTTTLYDVQSWYL
jgi:hypothetical protein